jgi:tricorn protease-like protein
MRSPSLTPRAMIIAAVATSIVAVVLTATNPALGQTAPAAPPDVSAAPSTEVVAPVPSPSPASAASPETIADGDGLILFGIDVPVAGSTPCTTFHTIRPDGSGERDLPGGCWSASHASWGPCMPYGGVGCGSGDSIIVDGVTVAGAHTIDEVGVDGDAPTVLLIMPGYTPAYSPDGSQIAYEGDGGIVIAAADDSQRRQLTSPLGTGFDFQPRFSPDGSRLVFTRLADPTFGDGVWMVNTDGTDLHRLTAALAWSMDARWSPDGSHLLFTGSETGSIGAERLWTIDADGTDLNVVSPDSGGSGRDREGDWSPDGSRIVYTHLEPGVSSLRVMNADGSGVTTLLSKPADNNDKYVEPDWGLPNTLPAETP